MGSCQKVRIRPSRSMAGPDTVPPVIGSLIKIHPGTGNDSPRARFAVKTRVKL